MRDIATETASNRVCRAENGQFIGFWRGNVVCKFDGTLRYFGSEQAAWDFLARRDATDSSILGISRTTTGLGG